MRDKATKTAFVTSDGVGPFIIEREKEHGLILRNIGDSVAFSPPLVITTAETEDILRRFDMAFQDTVEYVAGL